jgi:hypothetical protein
VGAGDIALRRQVSPEIARQAGKGRCAISSLPAWKIVCAAFGDFLGRAGIACCRLKRSEAFPLVFPVPDADSIPRKTGEGAG